MFASTFGLHSSAPSATSIFPAHFPLSFLFPPVGPIFDFLHSQAQLQDCNQSQSSLELFNRRRFKADVRAKELRGVVAVDVVESPSTASLAALEKLSNSVQPPTSVNRLHDGEHQRGAIKVLPSRNRYGRPYISGRPLLTCDRLKIVECYQKGMKKIHIAKQLGITHSCVSKVLRRYAETGEVGARACRTASCSCPGSSDKHDRRYCRHLQDTQRRLYSIENILLPQTCPVVYFSKPSSHILKEGSASD